MNVWPIINKKEIMCNLEHVIDSNRLTITGYHTGEITQEETFCEKFKNFNDVKYCGLTTGGTTALQLSLEALNIGRGDEVIVPALTWLATATAVLNVNAKPVFVDARKDTYCIDENKIQEKITNRTKAIIIVHLYGSMCNVDEIINIAKRNNLYVIEDCAQSHGAEWNNLKAGTFGDFGCFSFQQAKTITAGEGGAIITNNDKLFSKIYPLKTDSRNILKKENLMYGDMELYEEGVIQGNNYCLSELNCAVLNSNINSFAEINDKRNKNVKQLDEILKNLGYTTQLIPQQVTLRSVYCYTIDVGKANVDNMIFKLRKNLNVGSFIVHKSYPVINENKLFCPWTKKKYNNIIDSEKFKQEKYPNAKYIQENIIIIHHSILINDSNIDIIRDTLLNKMEN